MQIKKELMIVQKHMNSFEEAGIVILGKLIQLHDKMEQIRNNSIKNIE